MVGIAVGIRGDNMSGAPNGVAVCVLNGVARPGIAGDNSLCVSAAAAIAILLHSSSHAIISRAAKHNKKEKKHTFGSVGYTEEMRAHIDSTLPVT